MLKVSFTYLGASAVTQVINLLLVPVYTKSLTMKQYGTFSLIMSFQSFLMVLAAMGIYSGLSRFYFEYEDKNRLKNTALFFIMACSCFLLGALLACSPLLARLMFSDEPYGRMYIIYAFAGTVMQSLVNVYTAYYSMQYKAFKCSVINTGKVFLLLLLTIYMVAVSGKGLLGALQAQLLANGIILLFILALDFKNIKPDINREELKSMRRFGAGLVPGQAAAWVYTMADRFFLQAMSGTETVAVYSIGYRIGVLMENLFILPFKSLFTTYKYSVWKQEDNKEKIYEVFRVYYIVGWFLILALSAFARSAITILATPEYLKAFTIVPVVAFSYFLYGLSVFFSLGIHISNKSIIESYIEISGAVLNIVLNIVLIPAAGMYGAAYATAACYIAMNVLYYIIGRKFIDLDLSFFEPFKPAVVFVVLYGAYYIACGYIQGFVQEMLLAAIICLFFPVVSIATGIVPLQYVRKLANRLMSSLK